MSSNKTELYCTDGAGKLRYYTVEACVDSIEIEWGVVGGEPQFKTQFVEENNSGRDIDEQVLLEYNALIKRKLDKGYRTTIAGAKKPRTNGLGLLLPMLATPYSKVKSPELRGALVQYKYDGHRCLIYNDGSQLLAYSRNGKFINTIDHILSNIVIPPGWTLDGELYVHGKPLQSISSLVKKVQPDNKLLEFKCYDVITDMPLMGFTERFELILNNVRFNTEAAHVVPTWAYSEDHIALQFKQSKKQGYEGLIIRTTDTPYQDGKRSKSVIKVKSVIDDEFKVVDIHESKDGWAILECVMTNGIVFTVSAPGNMTEKMFVLKNKHHFLGKYVRVEFANLTKDGKPFHPVATMWRDKEGE